MHLLPEDNIRDSKLRKRTLVLEVLINKVLPDRSSSQSFLISEKVTNFTASLDSSDLRNRISMFTNLDIDFRIGAFNMFSLEFRYWCSVDEIFQTLEGQSVYFRLAIGQPLNPS